MAIREVLPSNTFEEFRQTFNDTAKDVGDIVNLKNATGVIANATDVVDAVVALNSNVTDGNFTNIMVTGNISNGSGGNLTLPLAGGIISTQGFSIALATALG